MKRKQTCCIIKRLGWMSTPQRRESEQLFSVFLYRIYFSIFLYTHLIMFFWIKLHVRWIYAHHPEGQGWTFPTVDRVLLQPCVYSSN